ncbi:MAG: DsrE family protein [Candidatus Eremiobacteraeota bacterium]|nr:DsrE family protein [Candidatus Eremiobacteraeota bacterium]
MQSKKVLVIIKELSTGENELKAKLRLMLGISAGYKEHKVDMVLVEDAVYFTKILQGNKALEKYMKSFHYNDFNIFVDAESLKNRNIKKPISEDFKTLNRDELKELLDQSDMTISI